MRTLSVAEGVAWRVLHNVFTNPSLLVPSLIFPLFFFTAFAGGLSRIDQVPGFDYPPGYTAFQFVFVLLQSAAFGGVFTGFGIARDFESGFGRRLLLSAPHRSGIVLGYAAAALVRWLVTAAVVTVVALLVGMEVAGSGIDLVGLYTLAVCLNIAAILWATGVALRLRTMQAGPVMQMPVFLLLFFAPVYVPLALLQGWIHGVATYNPITRVLEAGRGFLAGSPTEVGLAIGVAVALVLAFSLWALRGLRSAEQAGYGGIKASLSRADPPGQALSCSLGETKGGTPSRRTYAQCCRSTSSPVWSSRSPSCGRACRSSCPETPRSWDPTVCLCAGAARCSPR